MIDRFTLTLADLPTCDASGSYPTTRPTDLDLYILTSRAYRLAARHNYADHHAILWRVQQDANR